jgi:hypothetical protein
MSIGEARLSEDMEMWKQMIDFLFDLLKYHDSHSHEVSDGKKRENGILLLMI